MVLKTGPRSPLGDRLGIDPVALAQRLERSLRSLYCCSDSVSGRGAAVKYLSHSASLVVTMSIVPSPPHRGTKHLVARGALPTGPTGAVLHMKTGAHQERAANVRRAHSARDIAVR